MALVRDSALTFGMRSSSGSGVGLGRDAGRSIGVQTREASLDVVEVVPRVVKGMLEQATHVASGFSDGDAAGPRVDAGIVGESGEAFRGDFERLQNLVWIGVGVPHGRGIDQWSGAFGTLMATTMQSEKGEPTASPTHVALDEAVDWAAVCSHYLRTEDRALHRTGPCKRKYLIRRCTHPVVAHHGRFVDVREQIADTAQPSARERVGERRTGLIESFGRSSRNALPVTLDRAAAAGSSKRRYSTLASLAMRSPRSRVITRGRIASRPTSKRS
jgi:hypothetical protein